MRVSSVRRLANVKFSLAFTHRITYSVNQIEVIRIRVMMMMVFFFLALRTERQLSWSIFQLRDRII